MPNKKKLPSLTIIINQIVKNFNYIDFLKFLFFILPPRNVSPIIPHKLPFHIHGFCIRGIFTEHIPRE